MTATATRSTTMRTATVDDLPRLAPLAQEFYASTGKLGRFEIDRFIFLWTTLLGNGSGVIFLLEQERRIAGAIAGVSHPEPYSSDLIAQEFALFIERESRGGFGLLKLIRSFERWAVEKGCSQVRIGCLDDLQPEELGRLYVRMGYFPVERSYAKNIAA